MAYPSELWVSNWIQNEGPMLGGRTVQCPQTKLTCQWTLDVWLMSSWQARAGRAVFMVLVEISWFLLSKNSFLLAFLVLSLQRLAPFSACQRVTDSHWRICPLDGVFVALFTEQRGFTSPSGFWLVLDFIVIENAEDPKSFCLLGCILLVFITLNLNWGT